MTTITPVVIPDHKESELQDIDKVSLGNAEDVHHSHRDVDIDRDHRAAYRVKVKGGNLLVVVIFHNQHSTAILISFIPAAFN